MNLYDLLPTIYRRRDAELNETAQRALEAVEREYDDDAVARQNIAPLKALFAILQGQYDRLERDIGQLYDDWFVETCSLDALPPLAEPFAIADLDALIRGGADARALVADIMEYRRTKGSAGAFESYAHAATRWTVRVTDRLASMSGTSRVDGGSAPRCGYPDLRRRDIGARSAPRVTGAGMRNGFGPNSVEVEVFRARAMQISGVTPGYARDAVDDRHRTFSPVGDPKRLMRPAAGGGESAAVPYTRADARAELAQGFLSGIAVQAPVAGPVARDAQPLVPLQFPLRIADLSQWAEPPAPSDPQTVFVDPELGRLLIPSAAKGVAHTVDYRQAMNDGIGATPPSEPSSGSYDRTLLVAPPRPDDAGAFRLYEARIISRLLAHPEEFEPNADALGNVYFDQFAPAWAFITTYRDRYRKGPDATDFRLKLPSFEIVHVPDKVSTAKLIDDLAQALQPRTSKGTPLRTEMDTFERVATFDDALRVAESARGSVRIVLPGSSTHGTPGSGWTFAPQRWLQRLYVESAPRGRPTVMGPLRIEPRPRRTAGGQVPLAVELRGLNVGARIALSPDADATIVSCTLRPVSDDHGAWSLEEARARNENAPRPGTVRIVRSIVGGARLGQHTTLTVEDSIVTDAIAGPPSGGAGPALRALRSTFLANVDANELTASDVLFDAPVTVSTRGRGYARYCVVQPGSVLPPTYNCVPTPRQLLESVHYGHLRFARLRADAPPGVRDGSSTGTEIGAYGTYGEALRRANLGRAMDEYLPEGVLPHVVYRS